MHVLVLHNQPSEEAAVEEQDVLVQVAAVSGALERLGHRVTRLGCTLNLAALRDELTALRPDVVFNLVESLARTDRLMPVATMLLDSLGIPYTGAPTPALVLSIGKLIAKQQLRDAGLPTPAWFVRDERSAVASSADRGVPDPAPPRRFIIKSVWEHASLGIAESSVVDVDGIESLRQLVERRERQMNRPCFAEQFVEGREFNLSLLARTSSEPDVLPAAEIDFSAFPPGKPRIVDHLAKWNQASFEYRQTPRRFDFPPSDTRLLDDLQQLARRCWDLFGMRGYARVDFRVDESGRPWILEINANPCLSPDAGFAAAVQQAHLTYDEAIARILLDALA